MNRLLHDNFWIYIVLAAVLFIALIYFTPKLVKFLDDFVDRKANRREKKIEAGKADEKSKNRYKTF